MLKSVVSVLLAISMFFFAGCYEMVSLSPDQYKKVNRYDQVNVLTDTSGTLTKYKFSRGMCVLQKDTLVGTGTRISDVGEEHNVSVEIPAANISLIEVSKLNLAATMMFIGAAVMISAGAIFLAGAPGASGASGGGGQPNPQ